MAAVTGYWSSGLRRMARIERSNFSRWPRGFVADRLDLVEIKARGTEASRAWRLSGTPHLPGFHRPERATGRQSQERPRVLCGKRLPFPAVFHAAQVMTSKECHAQMPIGNETSRYKACSETEENPVQNMCIMVQCGGGFATNCLPRYCRTGLKRPDQNRHFSTVHVL